MGIVPGVSETASPEYCGTDRDTRTRKDERHGTCRSPAAIAHALRFDTWRSLVRVERLDDAEAAALMVDLVRAAAASDSTSD